MTDMTAVMWLHPIVMDLQPDCAGNRRMAMTWLGYDSCTCTQRCAIPTSGP